MQLPNWLNYRLCIFLLLGKISFSQQWVSLGGGANDQVRDIWVDTITNEIYASGNFTTIGDVQSGGLAKWDGTSWIDLCPECSNQQIYRIVKQNNNLYISGYFNLNNETIRLAQNLGSGWEKMADITNFCSLHLFEDTLYLTGSYTEIDGVNQIILSKLVNGNWEQVLYNTEPFGDHLDFTVNKIIRYRGDLIVAGQFNNFEMGINNIAYYDNGTFAALDTIILGGAISELVEYKGILYIGGTVKILNGAPADYLIAWNGEQFFNPFPDVEFVSNTRDLQIINDELYIISAYNYKDDPRIYYAAKFDGENFCSFGGSYDSISVTEYSPPTNIRGLNGEIYITARGMIHDDISWIGKWVGTEMDTCIYSPITVSLHEKKTESTLKLYPNPSKNHFKITFENSGIENEEISIFDQIGKEVLRQKISPKFGLNEVNVDVGDLKSGVYFVSLKNSGKYATTKLVKL